MRPVPEELDVNAVLGEPETVGETTIVPVTEILLGFSGGTGPASGDDLAAGDRSDPDHATRGGGYAHTRPLATIEVGPGGTRVHPIVDTQRVTLAAVLLSFWVVGWIALALDALFNRDA